MTQDPKQIVLRFYAEVSAGNLGVIDELIADDLIEHGEFPGIEASKEGAKQFFNIFRAAFPDLRMEAHEIVAEGDLICVHGTMSGTHQGEYMGMPASGKRFEVDGFDMVRVRGDQMSEHWGMFDVMKMMQQLGAIPENQ